MSSKASPMPRQSVQFPAGDSFCSAWLYRPATPADLSAPIVVMGHGLGATRELGLDPYAQRFVAAGMGVLVFTYRNLGDSGGDRRQVLSMRRQLQDWDAAIEYASRLPGIDSGRMAVWGSSLGGGHALAVGAGHPELRAVVSQCPFTDGLESVRALGARKTLALAPYVMRDLAAVVRGKEPVTLPVAARPGEVGLMTAPDALPGMTALVPAGHHWTNAAAARSLLSIARYRPGRAARRIKAPALICVSQGDSVAPSGPTEKYARQAPLGDVRLYPFGHFEFYLGGAFETLVEEQKEFLVAHLDVDPESRRRPASDG